MTAPAEAEFEKNYRLRKIARYIQRAQERIDENARQAKFDYRQKMAWDAGKVRWKPRPPGAKP